MLLAVMFLLQATSLFAQKKEEGFDYFFKPTDYAPRYYVVTEKKDSLWQRQAWYLPEKSMAMEGWYKDGECKVPHGAVLWYHTTKFLKSREAYVNGKKEGTWLGYDEEGRLKDSAGYVGGRLKGVRMQWYPNGMPADSMEFDGAGNGIQVSWYDDGTPATAGRWVSDTSKNGRWKYYERNGTVLATEDYTNGKMIACTCTDETGRTLDSAGCAEKEAEPAGGLNGWRRFLEKNLKPEVPSKNGSPFGQFGTVVRFIVNKDGTLGDIVPLTHFGFGMEEEVVRILKLSPRWTPGRQHGRTVKSYHTQPITFQVVRG